MNIDFSTKIYDYLVFFLIISMSFSKAIPNIALVLIITLYYTLNYGKEKEIKKYFFNFFSTLLLFLFLKKLFLNSLFHEFNNLLRLFFIVFIPFLFSKVSKNKLILSYIFSIFCSIVIASIKISIFYYRHKTFPFSNDAEVSNLLYIDRPYIGFACLTAAILSIYMMNLFAKYKIFFIAIAMIFIFFIFFIVARLSILTLIFLFGVFFIFFYNYSIVKKTIVLFFCLIILAFLLFNNQNLSNRFFVKSSFETIKDYEPRLVIWPCAFQIIKSDDFNFFFGNKNNTITEGQLLNCYGKSINKITKKEYFLKMQFNTHSQFISFFLEGGLITFGLFCLFVIELIIKTKANFYTFAIVISTILFFLIENVLYRQYGVYVLATLFSICYKILIEYNKNTYLNKLNLNSNLT